MTETIEHSATISVQMQGLRLDQAAAALFPDYSRARLQSWIIAGQLTLDDRQVRPRHKLIGGEQLKLKAELTPEGEWGPENIPIDIVFEDESLMVVNKAAGMVVHPAAGNYTGTLVNALLHYCPAQANLPRAGIVHRLDKDTSGLMVVAKTLAAHANLVMQLQARTVSREYEALACGDMTGGGKVDAPINRHPRLRKQMAVVAHGGKEAVTHYRLVARLGGYTHLRLKLETGRTHQIRVHMAHIRHPLLGDPVYGKRPSKLHTLARELATTIKDFPRQALHAAQLGLDHPATGEYMQWQAPLPDDMAQLLYALHHRDE
ncbi:23S rRNA pseudouridine(1911/1915/1917) synthase RluD [Gilvimarinus polysaccharolyticus]|uniref:23S rRNA pseudouridine(1911/1915/1917) synthase RluD n=1 Tax=Gilvimarinus polysaccharolyticus TaxID=863921 RepID=UPI00067316D5|nr:23S rRNA pseudouridine(1911/1915/1917) synthase RluD [Gilvimarinus polysaccharolyticus]